MTQSTLIASQALTGLAAYLQRIKMEPDAHIVGALIDGRVQMEMYPYRTGWSRPYAKAAVALHRAAGTVISERMKLAALRLREAA